MKSNFEYLAVDKESGELYWIPVSAIDTQTDEE